MAAQAPAHVGCAQLAHALWLPRQALHAQPPVRDEALRSVRPLGPLLLVLATVVASHTICATFVHHICWHIFPFLLPPTLQELLCSLHSAPLMHTTVHATFVVDNNAPNMTILCGNLGRSRRTGARGQHNCKALQSDLSKILAK